MPLYPYIWDYINTNNMYIYDKFLSKEQLIQSYFQLFLPKKIALKNTIQSVLILQIYYFHFNINYTVFSNQHNIKLVIYKVPA